VVSSSRAADELLGIVSDHDVDDQADVEDINEGIEQYPGMFVARGRLDPHEVMHVGKSGFPDLPMWDQCRPHDDHT
jgi:hypothetical protein